ncbi:MAG TPA: carbon-nitrogen hydrolase family protein [Kofleriaceae bacterium]|nr:carbon-nitrogen hydrolase family protein [Kofleriaceae bacterium]
MSIDGADPLRALRERIVELVAWFGEDGRRLPDAQDAWRRDELWDRRLLDEETRWMELLGTEQPLAFAPLASSPPARLLLELESLDHVAWMYAGSARYAPAELLRRGSRELYLVRLARERTPHAARQAGLIYTHLRYHALIPSRVECDPVRSYRVRVETMRHGAARCEEARARGSVTVATTSFGDEAPIDFEALSVPTEDERARKLTKAIADAATRGVDLFVAPELTVPPSARGAVLRALRWATGPELALLVPGSFHEREDDAVFNRAILVDGKGNELATHRKLTRFGRLEEGWLESIALGDEITVIVTPIGTVAIAICKDFCDDHVGRVWEQLQPEWLLVPAYGRGASAHETAARRIARMAGTVTILAHEGDRLLQADQNSFIHVTELLKGNSQAPDFFEHKIPMQDDLQSS